jgi:preprotein translocase subunit SecY
MKASVTGGFFSYLTIGFCLAAGTALAMWIGERITENGIGNGVSMLIFAGIIANFATAVANGAANLVTNITSGAILSVLGTLAILIVSVALIIGVVLVDLSERRIPIQYAKRMVGRKMYGGQSTHIPLRLNASGVLPLIFASSIMQFPATILGFFPNSGAYRWWNSYVSPTGFWYNLIFALMILGFTFFYSSITFNPAEMSKNIQQNGGMIPGIRQGKPTTEYITKINHRILLFGAFFLAFLALLPSVAFAIAKVQLPFAASSLLIAVSVAVEVMRQLESQMLMRHYKGFLK